MLHGFSLIYLRWLWTKSGNQENEIALQFFCVTLKFQQPSCSHCFKIISSRDYPQFNLKDYTLIRVNNSHRCKQGRVTIYSKNHLIVGSIGTHKLKENSLAKKLILKKKKSGFAISSYWSFNKVKRSFINFS